MTDEQVVAYATETFLNMMIGDVRRAFKGKSKVGALILSLCAIDTLSCYYADKPEGEPVTKNTGKMFKAFVADFMDESYCPIAGKLYGALRCVLVHGYTTKYFDLVDGKPHLHLRKRQTPKGERIFLNVDTFIDDVEKATKKYLQAVTQGDSSFSNLKIQLDDSGLMTVYRVPVSIPLKELPDKTA